MADLRPTWKPDASLLELLEEPALAERFLTLFLADTTERLAALRVAVEQHDGTALRRSAHGLLGGVLALGLTEMIELAERLQHLGRAETTAGADELVRALEARFERVRAELPGMVAAITRDAGHAG